MQNISSSLTSWEVSSTRKILSGSLHKCPRLVTPGELDMLLLDLLLEIFEEIIAALAKKVGQRNVVRYRLTFRKCNT
jgi:hypothetical protein